jgi:hypothetical protein
MKFNFLRKMMMKIKGSVILARKAFVEKHFGEGSWEKVIASLPKINQELIQDSISSDEWYPFAIGEYLDEVIVQVLGNGKKQVFLEIGATSAKENLSGIQKDFLTAGDIQGFMSKAPEIYKLYYNTGYRVYEPTGINTGVLTTHDADTFSQVDCLTVIGWYKEAIKMCGATEVSIIEETCRARGGPYCRYRIEWIM